MRVFSRTIQRKVLALVVALGVLPGALAVGYLYYAGQLAISDSVGNVLQDNALMLSTRIDARLGECDALHAKLSTEVEAGLSAEVVLRTTTGTLVPRTLIVLNAKLGSLDVGGGGISTEALVARVLGRDLPTARRSYVDEFETDNREAVIMLMSRLGSSDEARYVISAYFVSDLLRDVTEDVPAGDAQTDVYSNRGYLLKRGRSESGILQFAIMRYTALRSKFSGWEQATIVAGQPQIIAFASSRWLRARQNEARTSLDWIVLVKLGTSDIFVIIRDLLWRGFYFALLLIPVLLGVSWLIARRIIQPIKLLRSQAEQIAGGNLAARTQVVTSDELEELSHAFNNMAEQLSANRVALQQQFLAVESRARQLELAAQISRTIFAAPNSDIVIEKLAVGLRDILSYDGLAAVTFVGETSCSISPFEDNPMSPAETNAEAARRFLEDLMLGSVRECHELSDTDVVAHPSVFSHHVRRVMLVPLLVERGMAGVIVIGRRSPEPWEQDQVDSTVRIVQVLALALEHLVLYERLQTFAQSLEARIRERTAELERTHMHLIQTERFAATGRLAANVAHEINNPLGIIKNYLQILRSKAAEDFQTRIEALGVVDEELDRIARIVRSLLESYRPAVAGRTEVSVNAVIRSLLPLIEASLKGQGIKLCLDLDDTTPTVMMPPDHLRQVLLNLIRNAEDAVTRGGQIHIRTRPATWDGQDATMLQIEDDGCGILPHDRSRIFEPFFTTKREGQGSGLGLSVTLGLVRSLRGSIEVDTESGRGTTMTVIIPRTQSGLATDKSQSETQF